MVPSADPTLTIGKGLGKFEQFLGFADSAFT